MIRPCLVDGTYELFRAFYGAPSRRSPAGQEIGATYSLARNLSNLVKLGKFTHFAVAFDTVIESFRNELFPGYKTGEAIEPALKSQFELAERVTQALGFTVFSMIEYEADDALASAAQLFKHQTDASQICIASPDKDLMQLVDERIVTWDRLRDKTYDHAAVVEKMGVEPVSIPDYLSLVGDSADGIPGVPRWGARSAAQVLAKYKHLEAIPRDPQQWDIKVRGAVALAEQLKSHEEEVLLYRRLATLRSDVQLNASAEQMKYSGPSEIQLDLLAKEVGVSFAR